MDSVIRTNNGSVPNFIRLIDSYKDNKIHHITINGQPDIKSFIRYTKEKRYEYGSLINGVYRVVDYIPSEELHSSKKRLRDFILSYSDFTKQMEQSFY